MDPNANQPNQPAPGQPVVQPGQTVQPPQTTQPAQQSQPEKSGMSNDTKTIITVVVLLLFYPIGLILMWFSAKWPTWGKILITLPLLVIPVLIILFALLAVNPSESIQRAREYEESQNVQQQNIIVTPTPLNTLP